MPSEDVGLREHMEKAAAEAGVEAPHKSSVTPEPPAEAEPPVEATPEPKVEDKQKEEKVAAKEPSVLDKIAKDWGHVSEEDFKADPNNAGKTWIDAETFVRNMKPIADSHLHRDKESRRQLDAVVKTTAELLKKQEAAEKRIAEADKRAKEQLLNDLNAQLDAATDEGNKEGVRELAKKIAILHGEINAPAAETLKKEEETQGEDEGVVPASKSPTVARWMGRNEKTPDNPHGWYGDTDDPVNVLLTSYADKRSAALGQQGLTWKEIFETMEPEIAVERGKLQAKYAAPKATPASSSAGGGNPSAQSGSNGVSDLTPEERRAGQVFVKRGLYKDLAAYAKDLRNIR